MSKVFGLVFDERQNPQVGDAMQFRFVKRFDFKTRRHVNSVDKRKLIRRFADAAGCDDANLLRILNAVLVKFFAIGVQNRHAIFDCRSLNESLSERIAANTDRLAKGFNAANFES